jgi:hypothetical protein
MPTETIHMTEIDYCLVCGKHIGKGNDPAVCDNESCIDVFAFECAFNRWAAEQLAAAGEDE